MAARGHDYQASYSPVTTDSQRECARGQWCSAQARDDEGNWHPAPATQHVCPADQDVMAGYLAEIPPMYERLGERLTDPVRRSRPVRVSPGSRVLVSGEADELMHDIADWLAAWAIRVRAVPQLRLSRPAARYGTLERVTADCKVLADFPGPMLALELRDALRTWTFHPPRLAAPGEPPGVHEMALRAAGLPSRRLAGARPHAVACRRCGLRVLPSPSGRYWWPAQCTHAAPLLPAGERDDETGQDERLLCPACGVRVPAGWQAPPPCRHEAPGPPLRYSPIPAEVEDETGDLEVVRAGDGWVQCLTPLGGKEAALDVFELRDRAYRMLRESPAPRDLLDGIPCPRPSCQAMPALEVLPAPPPDPEREEREGAPDFCRCTACGERMTRAQYDQHVKRYDAWAAGAGILSCRRCERGDHGECCWRACKCTGGEHPRRLAG
jgi:hypothetical protein